MFMKYYMILLLNYIIASLNQCYPNPPILFFFFKVKVVMKALHTKDCSLLMFMKRDSVMKQPIGNTEPRNKRGVCWNRCTYEILCLEE